MKAISRDLIVAVLNGLLEPETIADSAYNGLQVEGSEVVSRIGFAVDCSLETIEKAIEQGADMLFVHHGLIWGGWKQISGVNRRKLELLLTNQINLYVSHLPLDKHPIFGNNAEIARRLGVRSEGVWMDVGIAGSLSQPVPRDVWPTFIESELIKPKENFLFGPDDIRTVAICSGCISHKRCEELTTLDIDAVIAGETDSMSIVYQFARENAINFSFVGHYQSETFGLRALMKYLSEKRPEWDTFWIDMPTGW